MYQTRLELALRPEHLRFEPGAGDFVVMGVCEDVVLDRLIVSVC